MRVLHSVMGAVLVAFVLLSASAMAEDDIPAPLFGFSGNWESTGTMFLPTWASDGSCTVGTTAYNYAWANYTFMGDGVRRLSSFEDFDEVYVYSNGFNPATPCQGGGMVLVEEGYNVEYYFDNYSWYTGGVAYTFVFVNYYAYGPFTGQITQGWTNATTNTTGQQWNPIYIDSYSDCNTVDQTGYQPYYQEVWFNVNQTAYYDISAYFIRDADNDYPSYTYTSLFKGSPNATLMVDACSAVGDGVELIAATYNSYQYSEIVWVHLVAGVSYTLVVSTSTNAFWGPFGWNVVPTRRFNFTIPVSTTGGCVGGFNEPYRGSTYYNSGCQANAGTGYDCQPYAAITFPIPSYWNFTVRTTESPNDYEFFLYSGENTNPSVACPLLGSYLDSRDSGSSRTYGPYSADEFTIIATPYYTGTNAVGFQTDVYVIWGPPITSGGNVPVVTTGSSSTTTGSVSTTGAVTTNVVTTTTGAVTTNVVTTTTGTVTTTTGSKTTTGTPVTTTTGSKTSTTTSKTTTTSSTSSGVLSAKITGVAVFVAVVVALLL